MKVSALIITAFLSLGMLLTSSCSVQMKSNRTKSKTVMTKNRNNPHHPNTTNPGKGHERRGAPGKSGSRGRGNGR